MTPGVGGSHVGPKLGIAGTRWVTGLRWPTPVRGDVARLTDDDPETRDRTPRQDEAENRETLRTTHALVGGMRERSARGGRWSDERGADEQRSCSRGATGWQKLSSVP